MSLSIKRIAILSIVNAQLDELNPPETKETLDRLIEEGFLEGEARMMICSIVQEIMFDNMGEGVFNLEKYISQLKKLSKK